MENKKSIITFFLIIAVVAIGIMGGCILKISNENKESKQEISNLSNEINSLENRIEELKKEKANTKIVNNAIDESDITEKDTVKYEFTSADGMAAQGNPGILKIYEIDDRKIKFEYNHALDIIENTIDREIKGIAEINNDNLYEYSENIDGHEYKITIKFNEEMIILCEYIDEEFNSQINLWS